MRTEYLQQARRLAFLSLGQFTANTTVTPAPRFGCPPIPNHVARIRILGAYVCASAIPADSDGTMLLNLLNNDISEGADDTLVSSADLEALVLAANKWYALTLATETSEKQNTIEEGDAVRATLVSNSAAINTNADISVCIEYIHVEDYDDQAMVEHTSTYIV